MPSALVSETRLHLPQAGGVVQRQDRFGQPLEAVDDGDDRVDRTALEHRVERILGGDPFMVEIMDDPAFDPDVALRSAGSDPGRRRSRQPCSLRRSRSGRRATDPVMPATATFMPGSSGPQARRPNQAVIPEVPNTPIGTSSGQRATISGRIL